MPRATPEIGTRLADRYRLERCVHTGADLSVWHATDEMLARPVGIYLLSDDHELAEPMITAARGAAGLDDSRFVRVLDAVRTEGHALVVQERLPVARSLSTVLRAEGPLDPAAAQAMITDAAEAVAAAHAAGLAHLRLQPDTVLLTPTGQVKILGLAVEAARHRTSSTDPARADTLGLGRVLYAALTGRWPQGEAFGLPSAPYEDDAICTPRQVRAGVPDALDALVDRLLNPAHREGRGIHTPDRLAAELRALRRARPPGPAGTEPSGPLAAVSAILTPLPMPGGGWKPSAATRGVQVAVFGMLAIGLGLLGWQIARAVGPGAREGGAGRTGPLSAVRIAAVSAFDPPPGGDGAENGNQARLAVDGSERTAWQSVRYPTATFGRLKEGVGLVVDLGRPQTVRQVKLVLTRPGHSIEVRAANADATMTPPDLASYLIVVPPREDSGEQETLRFPFATRTRFLLVWLTALPRDPNGEFRGGVSEISVSG